MTTRALVGVESWPKAVVDPSLDDLDRFKTHLAVREELGGSWSLRKVCERLTGTNVTTTDTGVMHRCKCGWRGLSCSLHGPDCDRRQEHEDRGYHSQSKDLYS